MRLKQQTGLILIGTLAGTVNGLLGAGGGMILVPMLSICTDLSDREIFPASIFVMLPICIISLLITFPSGPGLWKVSLPYLIGSGIGGFLAGFAGKKIPVNWLHRLLGVLILWGGYRYLC